MNNEIKVRDVCPTVFGISPRRYRQLADEGHVPRAARGKIDFVKATREFCKYQRQLLAGDDRSTLTDERRRKTGAEATMKELELQKMRGDIIPRVDVADELVRRVYVLKSDMLAIERRLSKFPEAKEIVKKQIRNMMRTYSRQTGIFSKEG
ncbi:MAG: hypothetical protein RBT20_07850 [Syntrophales bacterium]|jgi:hypothetical protein|nr:hypothetical protein [Syntrophales bacterium]